MLLQRAMLARISLPVWKAFEEDAFVFEAAQKPLDEYVVHPSVTTVPHMAASRVIPDISRIELFVRD